jgi:hypothetical protein
VVDVTAPLPEDLRESFAAFGFTEPSRGEDADET